MIFVSGIFTYLMIWWIVLFLVLPFGNAPSDNPPPGTERSAPANPRIKKKLIITSLASLVVWAIVFYLIQSDLISFRAMVHDIPD